MKRRFEGIFRHRFNAWVVWGLGASFALYSFLLQCFPSVMIPQLMETYQIEPFEIGILTSSFFYTYILLQVPAGIIVDLFGPRRVLKSSFFICSFVVGWFALSHSFWEGQLSRMIMGVLSTPALIAAFCLGFRWFNPRLFPLLIALTEFSALAGGIVGEAGLAYSVIQIGWRETMMGVAALGLFLTGLSAFIIHDYPARDISLKEDLPFKATFKKAWITLIEVLSIKQIWINGFYSGLVFGLLPAFAALWGIPYMSLRYDIPVNIAAILMSMFFIGTCLGTLILGWIAVHFSYKKQIMTTGALLSLFACLSVLYIPNISLSFMFVLIGLLGLFCSSYALAFVVAGEYVTHDKKGIAMGFTNMLCIIFGAPVLQPLIGFLLERTSHAELQKYSSQDFGLALSPLPICLLAAFLLSFAIKEKPRDIFPNAV